MVASRTALVRLCVCRLAPVAAAVVACGLLASAAAAAVGTLTVNTTKDRIAGHAGRCSLREAIEAVNAPSERTSCGTASRRSNVIVLRSGRYRLSIPPAGGDGNASGDLNVITSVPLTIVGKGSTPPVIAASGLGDRVLSVASGARLTLVRLTITGGRAPRAASCSASGANGGGIFNGGTLVLDAVTVGGNTAGAGCSDGSGQGGSGGGIYNEGRLTVTDSTVWRNVAGAGDDGGSGGGIYSGGPLKVANSTFVGNFAGAGGVSGGSGGAIAVIDAPSVVRNATIADNGVGSSGSGGSGADGVGGGLFVQESSAADALSLQNTIVAASLGSGCAANPGSAIVNGGYDLSYGDSTCPGREVDPQLGPLTDNGGPTETMAIGSGSAALTGAQSRAGDCPSTDQRGVRRLARRGCDIGAYQFELPSISVSAPFEHASYARGEWILARFRCAEGGLASAIARCIGAVADGRPISTGRAGVQRFVVTAIDKSGNRTTKTIKYSVIDYVNPLRDVHGLATRRIDLGVDYSGTGPLLAIGRAKITTASNNDSGPPSCWAISCWPGGGIVVYRLLDGPFAGKYVYDAEHIGVTVRTGQTVSAGQQIATLYAGYPWLETGWAAGPGPEALGMADGHRCTCSDPGGWSTIDGRNMDRLLVALGAPSGYLQASSPDQSMPAGWPSWPG